MDSVWAVVACGLRWLWFCPLLCEDVSNDGETDHRSVSSEQSMSKQQPPNKSLKATLLIESIRTVRTSLENAFVQPTGVEAEVLRASKTPDKRGGKA